MQWPGLSVAWRRLCRLRGGRHKPLIMSYNLLVSPFVAHFLCTTGRLCMCYHEQPNQLHVLSQKVQPTGSLHIRIFYIRMYVSKFKLFSKLFITLLRCVFYFILCNPVCPEPNQSDFTSRHLECHLGGIFDHSHRSRSILTAC